MSTTPVLDLPHFVVDGAAQYANANEMMEWLEIKYRGIRDYKNNTPIASPNEGDVAIPGATPTGLWAGLTNKVVRWRNGAWHVKTPLEGLELTIKSTSTSNPSGKTRYSGSAWNIVASGSGATVFTELTDAPSSYTGHGDKPVETNTGATGVGFGPKFKRNATVAPGVTNDSTEGYAVGSRWFDVTADQEYVCLDATASAAVWKGTTTGGGGGATTASELPFVPHGTIAATNVQTAIQEVRDEAAPAAQGVTNGNTHDHAGGDGNPITTGAIAAGAVTNTELANMAGQSIKANPTGSSAAAQDLVIAEQRLAGRITGGNVTGLTAAQAKALLAILASEVAYDNTVSGLTATDVQDALDELETLVGTAVSGMTFEGTFDCGGSAGPINFPGSGAADQGDFYVITNTHANGTILGSSNPITVRASDSIIARQDNASATNGAQWAKIDSTDEVSSVAGKTGAVTLVVADITDAGDLASLDQVDTAEIVNLAVTNGKIANNAVDTGQLATGAVTDTKIGSNAVTSGKIATAAVTLGKMETMDAGELVGKPVGASTGAPEHLTPAQIRIVTRDLIFNIGALRIVDMGLNSPPGSPAANDLHVVGATPAGGWSTWTAGHLALRSEDNASWINLGAPKHGYTGSLLLSASHHFKGAQVLYNESESLWHPTGLLHITTEHWTGRYFTGTTQKRMRKSFTGNLAVSATTTNVAHGVTLNSAFPAGITGLGILGNSTVPYAALPQDTGTVLVTLTANNANIIIGHNSSSNASRRYDIDFEYAI